VADPLPVLLLAPPPLDVAVTVNGMLTVRAVPSAAVPDSTMVWLPTTAPAGTLNCPLTVPVASGVRVPSVIGSDSNVTVTPGQAVVDDVPADEVVVVPPPHGIQPLDWTLIG
jgi:hypothetical protein